jgi:hypothetical protein
MVCFALDIVVAIPRGGNMGAVERRVEHLVRHCDADQTKQVLSDNSISYSIRVCDESTVALLRDLPQPFNVSKIDLLATGENLYTYRKHHEPPRIPLLKDVYWLAKSTERWKI